MAATSVRSLFLATVTSSVSWPAILWPITRVSRTSAPSSDCIGVAYDLGDSRSRPLPRLGGLVLGAVASLSLLSVQYRGAAVGASRMRGRSRPGRFPVPGLSADRRRSYHRYLGLTAVPAE